ncbi:fatty acid-binding protein 10-A, liver basic-like [Glandiceps talaboti]
MAEFIFAGRWKMVRSENFEQFLGAIGISSEVDRKRAASLTPVIEAFTEGAEWVFRTTVAPGKVYINKYILGEETDQVIRPNGDSRKVIGRMEGDVFVTRPVDPNDNYLSSRQLLNGELVYTFKVGDLVCRRFFQKID